MIAPTAVVGYLAASLVFATFCTTRMVPLRALAIASNIAFIGYGCLGELWPILILHAAMLPMNIHRLRQAVMLERQVEPRKSASHRPNSLADPWSISSRQSSSDRATQFMLVEQALSSTRCAQMHLLTLRRGPT